MPVSIFTQQGANPLDETASKASQVNYGNLMGGLNLTQMFASASSATNGAMYAKFQSQYQADQARFNATMQRIQAAEVRSAGDQLAHKYKLRGKQIKSAQRASYAAQGLEPDVGSGKDIQASTDYQSTQDAQTVRNNAWRQAFGLEFSADESDYMAQQAEIQGKHDYTQSLVSGGLQALGYGVSSIYAFTGK